MTFFLLTSSVVAFSGSLNSVSAAAGTVSGRVFDDKLVDGTFNGSDVGIQNVTVRAFDSTGVVVGSTQTTANGTYTLNVSNASTSNVRIEFDTPSGFQSSFVGTDNKTSIQFVSVGATNVSYGVANPAQYCANLFAAGVQGNELGATCFQPSNAQSMSTVYMTSWNSRIRRDKVVSANQTGSVWGLGYDGARGLLWTSAVVRRYSPMGPKKLCGIYATNPSTGTLALSFDLKADFGLNCGDDTSFGSNQTTARDLQSSSHQAYDLPAYPLVGKAGFGDLDVSPDGQYLFVTNLHDKKVYRFGIGGTATTPTLTAAGSWAVNSTCVASGSVVRPWGLDPVDGDTVFVGSVCANEGVTPSATAAPENATVQKMVITGQSTATWSTTATVDLSYVRACNANNCQAGQIPLSKWKAWTDDWPTVKTLNNRNNVVYPQPILSDIDFMNDGSMVIGVLDRFSIQMGWRNLAPDTNKTDLNLYTAFVHGDTLLMCKQGQTFVQESDGSCTSDTETHTAPSRSYAMQNATTPNREFFDDNFNDSTHLEQSQGGIAIQNGSSEVAVSMMDPVDWINEGGIRFMSQSTGSVGGWPYGIVLSSDTIAQAEGLTGSDVSFSKSGSIGDLEVLCNNAPVQIGNRIWNDINANGIQDPGEPGVAGVTVQLKRVADDYIWGTAVTDTNGNYYFSSNLTERWQGNGDSTGGGLLPNEAHYLRIANSADFLSSGPLSGYQLTTANATSAASSLDTSIDSNASATTSTDWRVPVAAPPPGHNNHTYDVGITGVVSVGDLVFLDANANGIQDQGETGIAGAVLTLTDMNGNPVQNSFGQIVAPVTTTSNGAYSFTNLPVAQYKVKITYPNGYGPTLVGQGTSSTDSSANEATSIAFTGASQSDNSLDFGVVPKVSVGDYVWYDVNHDGLQDSTDVPLQGVTLTLTKADGTPAYDTTGNLVTTTTTNAAGWYTFDNLPFGQYKVTVTPPSGYVPTVAGAGTSANDSSTGSAISVQLNTNGQRDPTLDFGFWGEVSVGDYVWLDMNGDGIQDATDVPLEGVTLSITKADGSAVTNSAGQPVTTTKTDATGRYSFDNLPFGQYKVTVTPPDAYTSTKSGSGTTATDSSRNSATSRVLSTNGDRDPTLDFGFVYKSRAAALAAIPNVTIGDKVWRDKNGDGLQGPADWGLPGAVVSVENMDGTPVVDITGALVKPIKTAKNGTYKFDGLQPGKYRVRIKYPSGWVPTVANRPHRSKNSSSRFATSALLVAGKTDFTLDFGVVTDKRLNRLPVTR